MNWLRTLLSGRPHVFIGGKDNPYLLRWYLLPRNRWLNLYLHKFLRDDDDRAMHDHPWWFASLVLKGRYIEFTTDGLVLRERGSIAFRRATHRHRVELLGDKSNRTPCWTLILTGPKSRDWGFWCPYGFVPWKDFVAADDPGAIGKGCGES